MVKQLNKSTKKAEPDFCEQPQQPADELESISLKDALKKYAPNAAKAQRAIQSIDEVEEGYIHIDIRKKRVHIELELSKRALLYMLTATTVGGALLKVLGA